MNPHSLKKLRSRISPIVLASFSAFASSAFPRIPGCPHSPSSTPRTVRHAPREEITKSAKMGSQKRIAKVIYLCGTPIGIEMVADYVFLTRNCLSSSSPRQRASPSNWPMSQTCTNGRCTWKALKAHRTKYLFHPAAFS